MARLSTVIGPNASNMIGESDRWGGEARSFATMTPEQKIAAGLTVMRGQAPATNANMNDILAAIGAGTLGTGRRAPTDLDQLVDPAATSPTAPTPPPVQSESTFVDPLSQGAVGDTTLDAAGFEAMQREDPESVAIMRDLGLIPPDILAVLGLRPASTGAVAAAPSPGGVAMRSPTARPSAQASTAATNLPSTEVPVTRAEYVGVRNPRVVAPEALTARSDPQLGASTDITARAQPSREMVRTAPDEASRPISTEEVMRMPDQTSGETVAARDRSRQPTISALTEGQEFMEVDIGEGRKRVRIFPVTGEDGVRYQYAPETGILYQENGMPQRLATQAEVDVFQRAPNVARILRSVM